MLPITFFFGIHFVLQVSWGFKHVSNREFAHIFLLEPVYALGCRVEVEENSNYPQLHEPYFIHCQPTNFPEEPKI